MDALGIHVSPTQWGFLAAYLLIALVYNVVMGLFDRRRNRQAIVDAARAHYARWDRGAGEKL